jgi:hypothetical protein
VAISRNALLHVDPTVVDFGDTETRIRVRVDNIGKRLLQWNVVEDIPWLHVSPESGQNDTFVWLRVERSALATGFHSGVFDVTSNGGTVEVTVTMQVPIPAIAFSPPSLDFPAGTDSLMLSISNGGYPGLQWSIASSQPWLTANPESESDDYEVVVVVDRTELPENEIFTAELAITSNRGNGVVPVVANPSPTATRQSTWGRIKALYRGED